MAIRSNLPQNYITKPGTVFEGFNNIADWAVSGNGTIQTDNEKVIEGSSSIKCTINQAGSNMTIIKNFTNVSLSPSIKNLSLKLYLHTEPSTADTIKIALSYDNTFTNQYYETTFSLKDMHKGWNDISIGATNSAWLGYGGVPAFDIAKFRRIRFVITARPSGLPVITLDSVTLGREGMTKTVIMFDDGSSSVYTVAFPYMRDRGLKGTFYINSSTIGTNGFCTKAQLDEMYADGWDIANHTNSHPNLSGKSYAIQSSEIATCRDWLNSNGYVRSSNHVAYPGGGYDDTTIQVMSDLGMTTGRGTTGNYNVGQQYDGEKYKLNCNYMLNTVAFTDFRTAMGIARNTSTSMFLLYHRVEDVPADTYSVTTSKFYQMMDWIQQNKIDVVTISQWFSGLINPRKSV